MKEKKRLDILLVDLGLCSTRHKAQGLIMAGLVLVDEEKIDKAGKEVLVTARIRILGDQSPYVGRGGMKLARALQVFPLQVQDAICLDVGASTGGFTDCLLQNGAGKVYAIDVGYGQLDWKLRSDPSVVVKERVNMRYLTPQELYGGDDQPRASLAVIDVSFISLYKILPAVKDCLTVKADIIALVKPQFEAGPEQVGKGGIVKDPLVHQEVLDKVRQSAVELGFTVRGEIESPIFGADGNKEFLLWLSI
ncbi:MAG: TlyA family RNA methyltransferase [Candidatus Margulisiibacteriota bacterium]|jgi:23S rRNA (cytidine1920-2'-O)/16S rRNA (cytidine1409-2'-O)-methyltransferase